jgi:hypothetical protein
MSTTRSSIFLLRIYDSVYSSIYSCFANLLLIRVLLGLHPQQVGLICSPPCGHFTGNTWYDREAGKAQRPIPHRLLAAFIN